jgi:hypothetical protein
MRTWSHAELHELMDGNPALRQQSAALHAQAPIQDLALWFAGKRAMVRLYASAVGCREVEQALAFVDQVAAYVMANCRTVGEWRTALRRCETHQLALRQLQETAAIENRCHPPSGNNYICYCR